MAIGSKLAAIRFGLMKWPRNPRDITLAPTHRTVTSIETTINVVHHGAL